MPARSSHSVDILSYHVAYNYQCMHYAHMTGSQYLRKCGTILQFNCAGINRTDRAVFDAVLWSHHPSNNELGWLPNDTADIESDNTSW
jgi:hypothetical protein